MYILQRMGVRGQTGLPALCGVILIPSSSGNKRIPVDGVGRREFGLLHPAFSLVLGSGSLPEAP